MKKSKIPILLSDSAHNNTIENPKFNFLTIACAIRRERKFVKLFGSIRSTNFV